MFGTERTIAECVRQYKVSERAVRTRLSDRNRNINGAGAMDDEWVVFGQRRKHRLSMARDAHKSAQTNSTVRSNMMANELPFLLEEIEREFEAARHNLIARVLNPFFERHGAGAIQMDWVPESQRVERERDFTELSWDETLKTLDPAKQEEVLGLMEIMKPFGLDGKKLIGNGWFIGWTIRQFRAMRKVKTDEDGWSSCATLDALLTEHDTWWHTDTGNLTPANNVNQVLGNCPAEFHPHGP